MRLIMKRKMLVHTYPACLSATSGTRATEREDSHDALKKVVYPTARP